MMFLGLTEYSIKHWELTANTKAIFRRSLIGGIVNVALNLIFIRVFGTYYVAAVTTFIGFFVYFLLARFGTRKYIRWQLPILTYVRIIGSGLIMFMALMLLKTHIPYTKLSMLVLVAIGAAVYGIVLAASGEVTSEIKAIVQKVKG